MHRDVEKQNLQRNNYTSFVEKLYVMPEFRTNQHNSVGEERRSEAYLGDTIEYGNVVFWDNSRYAVCLVDFICHI